MQTEFDLLALINQLPVHNGLIPVKTVHDTAVNELETRVAGVVKTYALAARLKRLANAELHNSAEADVALKEIAYVWASSDAAEELDSNKKNATSYKRWRREFVELDHDITKEGGLLDRIAAYAANATPTCAEQLLAEIAAPEFQSRLPEGDGSDVLTDAVKKAANAKFYQITESNLYNQSSVRLGHVPTHFNYTDMQNTMDFLSDDGKQRIRSAQMFFKALGDKTGGDTVHLFDVGHHDGQVGAAVARSISKTKPVHYTGVDMLPQLQPLARAELSASGLADDATHLEVMKFGYPDADPAQLAAHGGKYDAVIASHLYNVDPLSFFQQADHLQKPDGVTYLLHEGPDSWVASLREKHADKLRGGASDFVARVKNHLQEQHRQHHDFRVQSTVTLPELTSEEIALFKSMEPGVFDKDYAQALPEGPQREAFMQKWQALEYYLRSPLGAFTDEHRHQLVNDFQTILQQTHEKLTSYSEAQAVLSPKCSKEFSAAVSEAAAECRADSILDSRSTLRGSGNGRSL